MEGVISGNSFLAGAAEPRFYAPPSSPMSHLDLIEMMRPSDTGQTNSKAAQEGWKVVDDNVVAQPAVHSGLPGTRLPAATNEGVPRDFVTRPLEVVIDPAEGGMPGTGTRMLADDFRQQIIDSQRPPTPEKIAEMNPPPAPLDQSQLLQQLALLLQQPQPAPTYPPQPQPQPIALPPQYVQPPLPQAYAPPQQQHTSGYLTPAMGAGVLRDESMSATTEECDLAFLTKTASRPEMKVQFDFGQGGKQRKRYHDIQLNSSWLLLITDTRYDDDEFSPPSSRDGAPVPFQVTLDNGQHYTCVAPDMLSFRLGCMSVTVLIITSDSE